MAILFYGCPKQHHVFIRAHEQKFTFLSSIQLHLFKIQPLKFGIAHRVLSLAFSYNHVGNGEYKLIWMTKWHQVISNLCHLIHLHTYTHTLNNDIVIEESLWRLFIIPNTSFISLYLFTVFTFCTIPGMYFYRGQMGLVWTYLQVDMPLSLTQVRFFWFSLKFFMQFQTVLWEFNCRSSTKCQIILYTMKIQFNVLPMFLKKYSIWFHIILKEKYLIL